MTTHHEVLTRIPAEEKVRLTERSDVKGLRHLALYVATIVASSLWIAFGWPLWGIAVIIQGILLVFLFTLCHECTHQTPFKSVWMNELVGWLTGFILFMPFLWFRYFHLAHHRYTNDPDRDPELASKRPETWKDYLVHVSGVPFWLSMIKIVIHNALGRPSGDYLPKSALPRIIREARVMIGAYALVFATLMISPMVFWLWFLPVFVAQPFLRLYLLAEHGRCPQVANMLENSRTTFTNRIVRFLAWNMPYHIEHHSFPNVPFHALPALHNHMKGDLVTTSPSYARFTRDYASEL